MTCKMGTSAVLGGLLTALALMTGCDDHFYALTVPPPTKLAELDDVDCEIVVSKGVALAFECTSPSGPCENARISSADEATVEVREAYVDSLDNEANGRSYSRPRSAFVVVGKAPGRTRVTVRSANDTTDFEVQVRDD